LIDRCGDCPRQEIRTKYHGRFAPHAAPLCHVHLCNPANQRCTAYRDQRITNGTAGATVVKELNTLARVIDIAASEWGYFVAVNPVKQTRHPPIARGRERRLSTDEETALLQACDRSRAPMLKGIVMLALEAGMRLGELLALNWTTMDLAKGTARLGDTKNSESRTVSISTVAIATLTSLPRHISDRRVLWPWGRADRIVSRLVFEIVHYLYRKSLGTRKGNCLAIDCRPKAKSSGVPKTR
jgi:integrase